MRILSLLVLCFLVGCAARTPMAELEKEAEFTGDWTAVERRKQMDRKMNRVQLEPVCPSGHILTCSMQGAREVCGCVSPLDRTR